MNRASKQQGEARFGGNFAEETPEPSYRRPEPKPEPSAPLPARDETPEPDPQHDSTGSADPFESFKQKRRP